MELAHLRINCVLFPWHHALAQDKMAKVSKNISKLNLNQSYISRTMIKSKYSQMQRGMHNFSLSFSLSDTYILTIKITIVLNWIPFTLPKSALMFFSRSVDSLERVGEDTPLQIFQKVRCTFTNIFNPHG